jgi:WD40 repeat protein
MSLIDGAGVERVGFVGEFIDRAVYVGDEKIFPKGTNISVIRGSSNPTQNGAVCGEFVEAAGVVYVLRRTTSNGIGVYDVARAKLVRVLESTPSAGINSIAFKPDGSKGWISGDNPGGVYLFDPARGVGEKISTTAANAVVFPPGGSEVYASHRNSRFIRTYAEDSNLQVGADISTPNGADKLATNVGGSQVYAMSTAGKCVYVVDTATKTVLGPPITDTTEGIGSGLAGGSGNRCYTCKDSTVYSINTDTGTVEHQYESPGVVFSALRYVHETSRLYALSSLGKVIHC